MNAISALTSLLEQTPLARLGWTLLHSLWQGAIVVLYAALLLRLLRSASANVRYLVAVSALLLVSVAPVATWPLTQPPSESRPIASRAADSIRPASSDAETAAVDSRAALPPSSRVTDEEAGGRQDARHAALDAITPLLAVWESIGFRVPLLTRSLGAIWLLGVALMTLRLMRNWLGVRRLRRSGVRPAPRHVVDSARRIARRLGIRQSVAVLESALVRVPTALGWLRPVVLLPASAVTNLTTLELDAMLMHELAHVRRHDYLVNLLQSVIETLLFFHPAVWWLSRRIRIERENCCDDAAVALLGDRRLYTEALYRTAILGTADSQLAAAATGGDLSQRFRRLLGAPQQRETTTASTWAGVLAITLLAVLCAAAQVSPVVAQIEPPRPAGNQKTAPQQSEPQNAVPPQKLPELLVAQVETTPGPVEEAADAAETDVPEGGPTARDIWSAAQALNKAAIQEMIGAEPRYLNRLHENGFAALHWAADTGRSDALELLLELGANPNVKQGKYGGAPLQYAAAKGDVDAVRVLLARMAAVDAVDSAERTPLMWAAQNRRENVVKVLVEAGADVNAAMKGGWTPLHYAVQDGDAKTAQRLLDAGADFTLPNVQGKTAFEVGPELDVHVPRDFKPAPRPMPRPPAGSGSGSGSGGSDSGSGSGGSDSGGGGAPSGREPDPPSDSVPDENADRSSFSPGSGERFVAAPVETGRATVRVVSTEYAKADGKLERAIAWIENAATGDRAALLYETDGQFDIDLPVGRYELTFTGNGSRGATFQPTKRELAIETPGDAVDLGTVDLPLTVTSRLFGKPAPELDGVVAWKHTDPVRLGELRGKVVVLDFWAWYCTICHQHKPDLAKLHEEFGGRGLEVLAVHDGSLKSMDEMDEHLPDIARRYWGGKDLHLPIALDGSGDGSVFRAYGITAVPAVLLIDQEGRVVRRFHHAGDPDLKAEIARLLD